MSVHKSKRHGVDCHVGNRVSSLPCFGALMLNITTCVSMEFFILWQAQQSPEGTSGVR